MRATKPLLAAAVCATLALSALPAGGIAALLPPLAQLPELCTFASIGSNTYLILQPGWTMSYEGEEEGATITLLITVTTDTQVVDGVTTRVLVEEEREDNHLVEISRNYVAFCAETGSMFYFGEDVDIYENNQVVSHDGTWHAGEGGARPGVLMPASPMVGTAYFQELAPPIAMDYAIVEATDETTTVPAGTFTGVLHTLDGTPLEPALPEEKWYAPGIGLIIDPPVELVSYGFR